MQEIVGLLKRSFKVERKYLFLYIIHSNASIGASNVLNSLDESKVLLALVFTQTLLFEVEHLNYKTQIFRKLTESI